VLPIESCRNDKAEKNDPNHWTTLCIEEPFEHTNTARSVYDPDVFARIKEVFKQSTMRLKATQQLSSVFCDSLFYQNYAVSNQLTSTHVHAAAAVMYQQYNNNGKFIMMPSAAVAHAPMMAANEINS